MRRRAAAGGRSFGPIRNRRFRGRTRVVIEVSQNTIKVPFNGSVWNSDGNMDDFKSMVLYMDRPSVRATNVPVRGDISKRPVFLFVLDGSFARSMAMRAPLTAVVDNRRAPSPPPSGEPPKRVSFDSSGSCSSSLP